MASVPRVLPIAIRNLTSEYINLREISNKRKSKNNTSSYTTSNHLQYEMMNLEDPLNPNSFSSNQNYKDSPPIWVETVNRIKTDLAMIREKGIFLLYYYIHFILDSELARLHQSRLKIVFDDDQTSFNLIIFVI